MKFSDIDFSAISNMMNNMSDEQKEELNQMADNMMKNMKQPEPEPVEEEETDFYTELNIDEEDYADFGPALDLIEQAVDLESYYDDVRDVDFSASVLFLSKAVLSVLRQYHYSIYKNVLQAPNFSNPAMTTLYSYLTPLMNEDTLHTLVEEEFGSLQDWVDHKMFLQQLSMMLNRAEYDSVSYEELQSLKNSIFYEKALLRIKELA